MPQRARDNPHAWPETVTSQDVINFGLQRMAAEAAKYGVACIERNPAKMVEAVKGIRQIATRMDQFRRMKEKTWQNEKQQAQNAGRSTASK